MTRPGVGDFARPTGIIERLGISLLSIATPAVQSVFEKSVRNSRKIASDGESVLRPMPKRDPIWQDFCETYWNYTFVAKHGALTPKVMDAWYRVSAGNTGFAALAFTLAQRNEIGEREVIDVAAFERVGATDMAFLQPAIAALRSGKPEKLRQFDDLLFSPQYLALRKLLGASEEPRDTASAPEFDDIEQSEEVPKSAKPPKQSNKKSYDGESELPLEDPLAR